ncbi:MAG TPA: hypothetical protein VMV59_03815 [Candidatus Dormibacteraeota bacterium]|nr:hypothetical protein [Candidatus Dormibacteraeota bacterium]
MIELNGWKRLGILVSFAWIIGAGFYTVSSIQDNNGAVNVMIHRSCENNADTVRRESARRAYQYSNSQIAASPRDFSHDAAIQQSLQDAIDAAETVYGNSIESCDSQMMDAVKAQTPAADETAAAVALVPVPFGWAFAYLLLLLARWVKRGFMPG